MEQDQEDLVTESTAKSFEWFLAQNVALDRVKLAHIVTVHQKEARWLIDLAFEEFPALVLNLLVELRTDVLFNQVLFLEKKLSEE